ncbi:MAG: helix-turn-helix domain-containing protein [Deltaproteobacteria bacterium]|nr:helix-turn-helix domain-containing protein [Deltaproteobacteria bacterium]
MTSSRLRYPDAAEYIGIKIGTLRAMVHRRQVPHVRLGPRLVVFDVAALDLWLAAHAVEASR